MPDEVTGQWTWYARTGSTVLLYVLDEAYLTTLEELQRWTTTTATSTSTNLVYRVTLFGDVPLPYEADAERSEQVRRERNRIFQEANNEANRLREAQIRIARERAEALLISLLPEAERVRLDNWGVIQVTGSEGGTYRIRRGYSGNIEDEDGIFYCAHPDMARGGFWLPDADVMIAQMLLIQHDEATFLRIANRDV